MRKYYNISDMINQEIDDPEVSKVFEGHWPHGSSVRAVMHWSQMHKLGKFAYYDYGKELNMERYGQEEVPEISVEDISDEIPIAMFAGT